MTQTEEKFRKQLEIAKIKLEEIVELSNSEDAEDVSVAYEQIGELVKRLEKAKDATTDCLMEEDKDLEYIKQWTTDHKEDLRPFRETRHQIKAKMEEIAQKEAQTELEKQLYIQHKVNEEQTRLKLQQQKEIEEATILQQQREEEWYRKKLEFEKKDYRKPGRAPRRSKSREKHDNSTAVGKTTKVHNHTLFR